MRAKFCYVNVGFITMREEPKEDAKIASQALFGENIYVDDVAGKWIRITTPDGYKGWVKSKSFSERLMVYPNPSAKTTVKVSRLVAYIYREP